MKRNPIIIIGLLLLLIFGLLLFFFQVRTTEVAVVTTFGQPKREVVEPGAYLRWPPPINNVYKFDKRIHNFESKFEQVFTADGHSLLIMVYAGWSITQPRLFFPRFGDSTARLEEALEGLVRNAYSGVVGTHPFGHFISTDERQLRFLEIESEILKRVQNDVTANGYGVEVKFLGIKRIGLPESVTKLVFERMQSERQLQVRRIESEAQRDASDIRSAANLESANLIAAADAQATRIRGEGDAAQAQSLQVFQQNPGLANYLMSLRALEDFLKERATLILDTQTLPLNLLNGSSMGTGGPAGSGQKVTSTGGAE
ncbi:MAG: protease modulator HflC [Verrucomicrobia subdivision 3 bacterium]|nr:protease modulator HflC [Limisphaerales bacterium]